MIFKGILWHSGPNPKELLRISIHLRCSEEGSPLRHPRLECTLVGALFKPAESIQYTDLTKKIRMCLVQEPDGTRQPLQLNQQEVLSQPPTSHYLSSFLTNNQPWADYKLYASIIKTHQ